MIDAAFIGGPYDCKIMSVADDLWRMDYLRRPDREKLALMVEAEAPVMPPREYRSYQREVWTNGQRQLVMYVEEGLDRENSMVVAVAEELFEIRKLGSERALVGVAEVIAEELPFWVWPDDRKPCRRLAVYYHRFQRRVLPPFPAPHAKVGPAPP